MQRIFLQYQDFGSDFKGLLGTVCDFSEWSKLAVLIISSQIQSAMERTKTTTTNNLETYTSVQ